MFEVKGKMSIVFTLIFLLGCILYIIPVVFYDVPIVYTEIVMPEQKVILITDAARGSDGQINPLRHRTPTRSESTTVHRSSVQRIIVRALQTSRTVLLNSNDTVTFY